MTLRTKILVVTLSVLGLLLSASTYKFDSKYLILGYETDKFGAPFILAEKGEMWTRIGFDATKLIFDLNDNEKEYVIGKEMCDIDGYLVFPTEIHVHKNWKPKSMFDTQKHKEPSVFDGHKLDI